MFGLDLPNWDSQCHVDLAANLLRRQKWLRLDPILIHLLERRGVERRHQLGREGRGRIHPRVRDGVVRGLDLDPAVALGRGFAHQPVRQLLHQAPAFAVGAGGGGVAHQDLAWAPGLPRVRVARVALPEDLVEGAEEREDGDEGQQLGEVEGVGAVEGQRDADEGEVHLRE